MIHVLVADDQALVRSGFAMIVDAQDDMEVVGEASDGVAAVAAARRLHPDVVLMDLRMPGLDGIQATRQITRPEHDDDKPPAVLALTTFDLDEYVYGALRAGASGFLLKDVPPDELLAAIRVVAAGDALIAPSVTRRLLEEFARQPVRGTTPPPEVARLTSREAEVLRLLARGLSNAALADELGVSEATAKTHVRRVLHKLGVETRLQAVVLAYESGVVTPGMA